MPWHSNCHCTWVSCIMNQHSRVHPGSPCLWHTGDFPFISEYNFKDERDRDEGTLKSINPDIANVELQPFSRHSLWLEVYHQMPFVIPSLTLSCSLHLPVCSTFPLSSLPHLDYNSLLTLCSSLFLPLLDSWSIGLAECWAVGSVIHVQRESVAQCRL